MRQIGILLLLTVLLSTTAFAAWDATYSKVKVSEADSFNVAGYRVQVLNVDREEEIAFLRVTQNGELLKEGYITPFDEFIIPDKLRLIFEGFTGFEAYGVELYIKPLVWVEGKFVRANFPEVMHINNRNKVYVIVENTGASQQRFRVELREEGLFDRSGRIYQTPEHQVIPELLKVDRPVKYVDVPGFGNSKVEWLIGPNRRQPSYTAAGLHKSGNVQFILYAGDEIIDVLTIPNVRVSSEQSGYIADVEIPSIMIQDTAYEGFAILQNTGFAQSGVLSDNFNFKLLSTDSFEMIPDNIIRAEIPAHTEAKWGFRIRPLKAGEQTLRFSLSFPNPFSIGAKTLDEYSVPITVIEGFSTRIARVLAPQKVGIGETFEVPVVIQNLGPARDVNVQLNAPSLLDEPITKFIMLPGFSDTTTTFKLEAIGVGHTPINAKLFTHKGTKENINFDPYDDGKQVSTRTVTTFIFTGEEPVFAPAPTAAAPVAPVKEVEVLPTPQPVPEVAEPVRAPPLQQEVEPLPLPTAPTYAPNDMFTVALLIIVVFIIILVGIVILNSFRKD